MSNRLLKQLRDEIDALLGGEEEKAPPKGGRKKGGRKKTAAKKGARKKGATAKKRFLEECEKLADEYGEDALQTCLEEWEVEKLSEVAADDYADFLERAEALGQEEDDGDE